MPPARLPITLSSGVPSPSLKWSITVVNPCAANARATCLPSARSPQRFPGRRSG